MSTDASKYVLTDRDEAIYEAVEVLARPVSQVAEEFGLSAGEIKRIARQAKSAMAEKWLELNRLSDTEAVLLRRARLEGQWRLTMESFHRSQQPQMTVTLVDRDGDVTKTTTLRSQCGEPKYLTEARRVLVDLQVVSGMLERAQQIDATRDSKAAMDAECHAAAEELVAQVRGKSPLPEVPEEVWHAPRRIDALASLPPDLFARLSVLDARALSRMAEDLEPMSHEERIAAVERYFGLCAVA